LTAVGGQRAGEDAQGLRPFVAHEGERTVVVIHPLRVMLVRPRPQAQESRWVGPVVPLLVLPRRLIQEGLVEFGLVLAGMVDVMTGVEPAAVPLDLGVDIIAAAGGIESAL